MPQTSAASYKRPRKLWWLVGLVLLALFALLQMPASWVLEKYAPNSPYVQHVSGNIWQGSAIWQLPVSDIPPTGSVDWRWQPWQLLLGKVGADIEVYAGQTRLDGQVKIGRNTWQVTDMSGKISPETLAQMIDWQLPNAPIQVSSVSVQRRLDSKNPGFVEADGQLTWTGGEVGYPSGDKVFYIAVPTLQANLSAEQKDDKNLLHMNLINDKDQRLGDLYLDHENMLDISLTQRLLENMPEYQGQAPQDTPVVSVRQPLLSGVR